MTPSENYIGKDALLEGDFDLAGILAEDSALSEKMRATIQKFTDEPIIERIRKLEAIKAEHEVQERAKAYRQIEGLTPQARHIFALGDESAPGYLWDLVKSLDGFDKATIRHNFTANQIEVVVSKHGPEFEVG